MSTHALIGGTLGPSRKRKDRELFDPPRAAKKEVKAEPTTPLAESARPAPAKDINNRLLAGFLAHEFLTRGTLFGKRWEAGRSGPAKGPVDPNRAEPEGPASYAEASYLLMRGGAHVANVVNPTQLARWLQM
ncbi:hypothetical protein Cni_G14888 [Canna indica]|uniref:Uncharacterized protein n=1 Tax=Canna indica TaxID=4628 RepID=A0AAQ3QB25_9LILI|nr:hypothetical protein Cni_G14888 [Canna indica]